MAMISAVTAFAPDLVVNAAAYTAVDKAEGETDLAFLVNRDGARNIAAAARTAGAPLIHISTDYVFDGTKAGAYVETDLPNPISVYGASKLAGELAVMAEMHEHVILRTSWICSPHGSNFVKTILSLAKNRGEIDVVDDQWGSPTFAADLAMAICSIGDTLLSQRERKSLFGIYHATSSGETTWCGLAHAIANRLAMETGRTSEVRAIRTDQYPFQARRPANSRLDCTKLNNVFGIGLPDWRDSLKTCLDQIINQMPESVR
jgi:dTDP-4-dehydrorhamnose reductase